MSEYLEEIKNRGVEEVHVKKDEWLYPKYRAQNKDIKKSLRVRTGKKNTNLHEHEEK